MHNPPHILKQRLKDNKLNSLCFARECIRIFFLGHYLFLQAHSFPRALLSKNCSHLQVEQIKPANKYPYVFYRQIEAIAYLVPNSQFHRLNYILLKNRLYFSFLFVVHSKKMLTFFVSLLQVLIGIELLYMHHFSGPRGLAAILYFNSRGKS